MKYGLATAGLAALGATGIIWGNDTFAKLYKKITNKELLEVIPKEHEKVRNFLEWAILTLSVPTSIGAIVSGFLWIHAMIYPPRPVPPLPAPPPPLPPEASVPCEDQSKYDDALNADYEALVVYFRDCPFVNSGTESIVRQGVKAFTDYMTIFSKDHDVTDFQDAMIRSGSLGDALMTYTFANMGAMSGTKILKQPDPDATVIIKPWPDPQEDDQDQNDLQQPPMPDTPSEPVTPAASAVPPSSAPSINDADPASLDKLGDEAVDANEYSKAFSIYNQAAAQGDALADDAIGNMYDAGHGVRHDPEEAKIWYQKSANKGYFSAEINLGLMYEVGDGMPVNDKLAEKYFLMAANQGGLNPEWNMGRFYEGIHNYQQARIWYQNAASVTDFSLNSRGVLNAAGLLGVDETNLGVLYAKGEGGPQDYSQAAAWFEKGAANGNGSAEYNLGILFDTGAGVAQDCLAAREHMENAQSDGYDRATSWLAAHPNKSC